MAKFGWRTVWGIMMAELAPNLWGAYVRPATEGIGECPKLEDRDYVLSWATPARGATDDDCAALRSARPWSRSLSWTTTPRNEEGRLEFYRRGAGPWGAQDGRLRRAGIEGRCTAPLLVQSDGTFVSNESGDIVRALIEYKGSAQQRIYGRRRSQPTSTR